MGDCQLPNLIFQLAKILKVNEKPLRLSEGLFFCGEYRSRTDDLLHAMQALQPAELIPLVSGAKIEKLCDKRTANDQLLITVLKGEGGMVGEGNGVFGRVREYALLKLDLIKIALKWVIGDILCIINVSNYCFS